MTTFYKFLIYGFIISSLLVGYELNHKAELKRSRSNHPTARKITR